MNLINIEDLTKVYAERKLFDGASFSLQDGEKIGVIGINGTGKTTLLRMIMGEEETDEGTVTTANHVVIRYLPQHPEFEPEKSSLECVLEGNVTDENRWSVESDARAMMMRLGIKDFMQPAGQLSGGQRKRLALISVLLSPADILLLDEPTNHLDNDMADWLEDYLKKDGKLGIADDEDEDEWEDDEEDAPEFKYEEKLPIGIDDHLNLYQYETFCYTNMKVILKEKNILKTENRRLVFY